MQGLVRLHVPYEQTDGGVFVMQVDVAPGGSPPPLHTHAAHEFFWTLSGQLNYFRKGPDGLTEIAGRPRHERVRPRWCAAHLPQLLGRAGELHLGVLSPPQDMQDFLVEAGSAPGEEFRSPEKVLAIGERFGLVMLDVVPEPRG